MKRHHNWDAEYEWHVKTPGVTLAISNAVRAVTDPGDSVIINQPVYYPFTNIILQNSRKMVTSDLVADEKYERINVACPRETLTEALVRIENAVKSI